MRMNQPTALMLRFQRYSVVVGYATSVMLQKGTFIT